MHYYKRNLGDYAKKAGRLTMLQHGAYNLLIDACYDRERFPTREEAIDWAWAASAAEIEAVEFVLRKFFTLTDGVYVQERIQQELDEFAAKSAKNKQIAHDRETKRARNVDEASPAVDESSPNQEPITINQEPEKQKPERVPRSADRFEDFWRAYPNKKGRKDAEATWRRKGLDAEADLIIADVRRREKHDRDWLKGYCPHGSTYVNAEGWRDGLPPTPLPQQPAQMQPSRQMQAIQNLLRVTPHESNEPANMVPLDAGNGFGSDLLALPPRLTGG